MYILFTYLHIIQYEYDITHHIYILFNMYIFYILFNIIQYEVFPTDIISKSVSYKENCAWM